MKVMSEVRKGLNSGISMKCEMCNFQEIIWTEDPHNEKMPVNTAAVSGIMKIGGGFANLEEFLSTLDIPPLSSKTYQKEHNTIATAWEKVAEREMYSAAMEEKAISSSGWRNRTRWISYVDSCCGWLLGKAII
ncbi:uncharacterized protein TNCT_152841 [Trichonephila clavata]|uniref:Mutator-like transposase domain-containing protein n=1 Tax=Trichonephila clavata TaxID=2740835 RepID=A0A8X6GF48_TRICU|nr:uncharacterized protein TNCT_152841 [Trichonephila clavata]